MEGSGCPPQRITHVSSQSPCSCGQHLAVTPGSAFVSRTDGTPSLGPLERRHHTSSRHPSAPDMRRYRPGSHTAGTDRLRASPLPSYRIVRPRRSPSFYIWSHSGSGNGPRLPRLEIGAQAYPIFSSRRVEQVAGRRQGQAYVSQLVREVQAMAPLLAEAFHLPYRCSSETFKPIHRLLIDLGQICEWEIIQSAYGTSCRPRTLSAAFPRACPRASRICRRA